MEMIWPFTKKSAADNAPRSENASSGVDANELIILMRAFESIGVSASDARNKRDLAARAASELIRTLEKRAGGNMSDTTKAMFLLIASNHFSKLLGTEFEISASLAFMHQFELRTSSVMPESIEFYNTLASARSGVIGDIGNAIAVWCMRANEETLQSILKRFVALNNAFDEAG